MSLRRFLSCSTILTASAMFACGCSDLHVFAVPVSEVVSEAAPPPTQVAATAPSLAVKAKNFGLLDQTGRYHELRRYGRDAKAIVIYSTGNGCPIARLTASKLMTLRDQFGPQGVIFLMLNANPLDDRKSVAEEATAYKIDIPILIDDTQLVATQLGITRTCEALVITPGNWEIAYRGAIDDSVDYEAQKPEAKAKYLEDAIKNVLAETPVKLASTEVKGCLIDIEPLPTNVSYAKDIAPIIKSHCVECHRPGNIGPFAFAGYDSTKKRSNMMREVLMSRRMPPWHADAPEGIFKNDSSLNRDEMRTLIAWYEAGAPQDGEADPLAEVGNLPADEWTLGKPDLVIEAPKQTIPATGTVPYISVEVPSGLTEDKWVRAAVVQPSNLAVTHHALVFLRYPDAIRDQEPDFDGGLGGYFGGYVPGQAPAFFPEGTAKWIPAGVTFEFQLHYTTSGKEEADQIKLGLYFTDEKPERLYVTNAGSTGDFEIPPNTYDSPAETFFNFYRDSELYSFAPHMHYRGSHMKFDAFYPDGSVETLLSVPNYQFNWQTAYTFAEPKKIPGGTRVRISGGFDNSVRNAANPDPNTAVRFGEQTWEEMFVSYVNYTEDPNAPVVRPKQNRDKSKEDEGIRSGIPIDATNIIGTEWFGDKYTFEFLADGKMTVNKSIKGTYEIVGDELRFKAAARDFTFFIRGDVLCPDKDRDWHFRRTK